MSRKLHAYLWDLENSIAAIVEFTGSMSLTDFEADSLVAAAVERKISILGEALRQMVQHYPRRSRIAGIFNALIGFQEYLLHQYARVNRSIVWDAVLLMPQLREKVEAKMAEAAKTSEADQPSTEISS